MMIPLLLCLVKKAYNMPLQAIMSFIFDTNLVFKAVTVASTENNSNGLTRKQS